MYGREREENITPLTIILVCSTAIPADWRPLSPSRHLQRQDLVLIQVHVLISFRWAERDRVNEFQWWGKLRTLRRWFTVSTPAVRFAAGEPHHLVVVTGTNSVIIILVIVALFADKDDVVRVEELVLGLVEDYAVLLDVAASRLLQKRLEQDKDNIKKGERDS